jgi:predicted metal-dependent enzyme (double-stranded beta helix superfamily)
MPSFDLDSLVSELRTAAAEDQPARAVRWLMTDVLRDPVAVSAGMPEFENDDEILFEDDSVSIWLVRFVPGIHVPPHDHRTTATIGVYDGAEINHFYLREPDRLLHKSTRRVAAGEVIALKPDGIHSVEAADGRPSLGIHVYLGPLTRIERSLFDWQSGAPVPFTDQAFESMTRRTG